MYAFFIIGIIITAAIAIIAITLSLPKVPEVQIADKLPISGIMQRIELYDGKSETVALGKYCIGLLIKNKRLSKLVSACERTAALEMYAAENIFIERRLSLIYKSVKKVKLRRLFAVCSDIVSHTRGDISEDLYDQIDAAIRERGFFGDEVRFVRQTLELCSCALILSSVELENEDLQEFSKGATDGRTGSVDLNKLCSSAYVCGLYSESGDNSDLFDRLLEINGLDKRELLFDCIKDRAVRVVDITCAIETLGNFPKLFVDKSCEPFGDDEFKSHVLNGKSEVITDSHGNCSVRGRSFGLKLECGKINVVLRDCDGIFQRYRTVYRTVCDFELAAEIISPFDFDGMLCKVTLINGNKRSSFRLSIIGDCVCDDRFMRGDGMQTLSLELSPFQKYVCYCTIVIGDDAVKNRQNDMLGYGRSYNHALVGAAVFSQSFDYEFKEHPTDEKLFLYAPPKAVCGEYTPYDSHYDGGDYYTVGSEHTRQTIPAIAIETGGKLYLPFAADFEVNVTVWGERYVSHCGEITFTLTRYRSGSAEIFDLSCDAENAVKILFAADIGSECEPCVLDNAVYFKLNDKRVTAIYCTENIAEFTKYSESYSSHGKIDRAHGLRNGGVTFNPAVVCSCGRHIGRVAFCIDRFESQPSAEKFDLSYAERILSRKIKSYDRGVMPRTSDEKINFCFLRALSAARAAFERCDCAAEIELLPLLAELYTNSAAARAKITRICKSQYQSGRLDGITALILPIAADEFAQRIDKKFLNEKVGFCDGSNAAVLEHCLRALECVADGELDIFTKAVLIRAIVRYVDRVEHARRKRLICIASKIKSDFDGYIKFDKTAEHRAETLIFISLCDGSKRLLSKTLPELDKLLGNCEDCIEKLGAFFSTAYSYLLFSAERFAEAYSVLRNVTEYLISDRYGVPRIISESDKLSDTAALYYLTVAEKIFGISLCGDRISFSPCVAHNAPHIEFDIHYGDKPLRVTVDDGIGDGSWNIRMGRIALGSNTVGINQGSPITLFKNSCKKTKRVI